MFPLLLPTSIVSGNCSSDNGGLELPAVIFRIKVPLEQWAFHIDLSHNCLLATAAFPQVHGKGELWPCDQIVQYPSRAGGSFGGNATIASSTRRYCQLCAPRCKCIGALINFSPESVGLPPLELGYFRGLKGDKWVSAGYLLPLWPPITHPTAASAFTAQVFLSSVHQCATLLGKCHCFLPWALLPPNPQFSHWLTFSSCLP